MPEHLNVELRWPTDGLDVVPAPEGTAPDLDDLLAATLALRNIVDQRLAEDGDHQADAATPTSVVEAEDRLRRAERALVRLEQAALDVSAELTAADALLDAHRPAGAPGPRAAPERRSTAVTWPPRVPGKRSRGSRARRERWRVLVPLLLVVALAGAAVGYRAVHDRNGTGPAAAAGDRLTVAGITCRAGTSVATVRVTSVRQGDAGYVVWASGLVSNASAAPLRDVVVHWAVTYRDGRSVDGAATLSRGDTVAGHGLGGWVLPFIGAVGPSPAIAARVTGLTSVPAQPTCR